MPWVYDTLDHRIGGFGQQQGGGQSITFTSQYGTVNLSTLPVVSRDGMPVQPAPAQAPMQTPLPAARAPIDAKAVKYNAPGDLHSTQAGSDDVIALLDRLGQLMEKGYISKEEFASKKSELLNRI